MNHEQETKKIREATIEDITEALQEGDRSEGWRLFDEWEQLRLRENDEESSSMKRLAVAVESVGFHVAEGQDADNLSFEMFTVGDAISSDTSLTDTERELLKNRFAEVTASVL